MKKTLTAVALSVAAFAAVAATGIVSYDYDNADAGPQYSQHETNVGFAVPTVLGNVDFTVLGNRLVTGKNDYNLGFQLGVSQSVKMNNVTLLGRVGYGQVNGVDTKTGGWNGNTSFYSLSGEASMPIRSDLTGFVGYRWRGAISDSAPNQQRVTVGVEFPASKVVARVGYAYTYQNGYNWNGLTGSVGYKF